MEFYFHTNFSVFISILCILLYNLFIFLLPLITDTDWLALYGGWRPASMISTIKRCNILRKSDFFVATLIRSLLSPTVNNTITLFLFLNFSPTAFCQPFRCGVLQIPSYRYKGMSPLCLLTLSPITKNFSELFLSWTQSKVSAPKKSLHFAPSSHFVSIR